MNAEKARKIAQTANEFEDISSLAIVLQVIEKAAKVGKFCTRPLVLQENAVAELRRRGFSVREAEVSWQEGRRWVISW